MERTTLTISTPTLDFSRLDEVHWAVWAYAIAGLLTVGVYRRIAAERGIGGMKVRVMSLFWGALWPIYWLIGHGLAGIVQMAANLLDDLLRIVRSVLENSVVHGTNLWLCIRAQIGKAVDDLFVAYFVVAFFFMPAFQIYLRWDACSGFGGCTGDLLKSFLWGIVWPVWIFVTVFDF